MHIPVATWWIPNLSIFLTLIGAIWNATNLPHSINATYTHDTKRGERVRARINVLSEIPKE